VDPSKQTAAETNKKPPPVWPAGVWFKRTKPLRHVDDDEHDYNGGFGDQLHEVMGLMVMVVMATRLGIQPSPSPATAARSIAKPQRRLQVEARRLYTRRIDPH